MSEILQVKKAASHIDDITSLQYHTYTPYSSSFNNNDEIRITIQSQDLYIQPSDSYLYIEFAIAKRDGTPFNNNEAFFTNSFTTHMFSEMRYELNGYEIDRCKSPGITSYLKRVLASKSFDKASYELLSYKSYTSVQTGTYRMMIPLRFIFGFCDDYNKVILNSKHELILVRSRSNLNMYQARNDMLLCVVNKVQWKIPHITLSDHAKLQMMKTIQHKDEIPLTYRSWDLYELPTLPQTTRHSWNVKTTTQVTKPRYVVVAFQTNRNMIADQDATAFDHCNISDIKVHMNNERYPYDDMNLNFVEGNYLELFNMFTKIQQTYYNETSNFNPVTMNLNQDVNIDSFGMNPIFVFDCSRSDERIKNGMVDVRIEMETRINFHPNTAAYCLIIHDNLVRYSPFTGHVIRDI